jgi:hypothetical protein
MGYKVKWRTTRIYTAQYVTKAKEKLHEQIEIAQMHLFEDEDEELEEEESKQR